MTDDVSNGIGNGGGTMHMRTLLFIDIARLRPPFTGLGAALDGVPCHGLSSDGEC